MRRGLVTDFSLAQRASLVAGGVMLVALWFGPLPELSRHWFWAHMTMHMGVVAIAAPVVAVGLAGTSFDLARRFPRALSPVPLSVVELIIVWGWHAPALHQLARSDALGLAAEQGSFLIAGLLVWASALGGRREASRKAQGIIALLLTSMHMTLLGALLALSPRPLYGHMHGSEVLSAIDDQHLGGAIMLFVGGAAYLIGGLWLSAGLLRLRTVRSKEEVG